MVFIFCQIFLLVRLFGYAPFLKWFLVSTNICWKLNNSSELIVYELLHSNNYLILTDTKVERVDGWIFSEKVVMEKRKDATPLTHW